jgi:predicted amidophosphoribosyltransferase
MKCKKCIGAVGLPAVGNCSGCGAMIGHMSDTYCAQCSTNKNACQGCGTALTPANSPDGDTGGNGDDTSGDGSSAS